MIQWQNTPKFCSKGVILQDCISWQDNKSIVLKCLYLSLKQFVWRYQIVDGVIAPQGIKQVRVELPKGLSAKESKQYIKNNQADLLGLDQDNYTYQSICLVNQKTKTNDAVWLMAMNKHLIEKAMHRLRQNKKVVCRLLSYWQHALMGFTDKKDFIFCGRYEASLMLVVYSKKQWVHIDRSLHASDHFWLKQQLGIIESRICNIESIKYYCSDEANDFLKEHSQVAWQVVSSHETY